MAHTLPELPFGTSDLAPYMSEETLSFHYGKHHQAYVTNLNKLIEGTEYANLSLEDLIKSTSGGIFNNAAQIWNHTFFWSCLSSDFDQTIPDKLSEQLNENFGSVEAFKQAFTQASLTLFGSGWAWLVQKKDGTLEIIQTHNAETPLQGEDTPLLTCDVWEHAYYIDTRNQRPAYLENFWHLVNWKEVANRLQ